MAQDNMPQELQDAVDAAQSGNISGLHQTVIGPPGSGKVFYAGKYAKALQEKGIAAGWQQIDAGVLQLFAGQRLSDKFRGAGGIVVIDDLDKAEKTMRDALVAEIIATIDRRDTVVILTGAPSLENFISRDTALAARLPVAINVEQISSEQIARAEAVRKAHAQREKERAQRIADWKTAKDEDLRPKTPIAAPRTARFRKPEGMA